MKTTPCCGVELGEQFGVSRTAVREAVKTLTAKGWFYRDRELVPGHATIKLEFS